MFGLALRENFVKNILFPLGNTIYVHYHICGIKDSWPVFLSVFSSFGNSLFVQYYSPYDIYWYMWHNGKFLNFVFSLDNKPLISNIVFFTNIFLCLASFLMHLKSQNPPGFGSLTDSYLSLPPFTHVRDSYHNNRNSKSRVQKLLVNFVVCFIKNNTKLCHSNILLILTLHKYYTNSFICWQHAVTCIIKWIFTK